MDIDLVFAAQNSDHIIVSNTAFRQFQLQPKLRPQGSGGLSSYYYTSSRETLILRGPGFFYTLPRANLAKTYFLVGVRFGFY